MSQYPNTSTLRVVAEGIPTRVSRVAQDIPQSTQEAIFYVSGLVSIVQIVGEVTTVIGSGANNMQLISNPDVGADAVLCAVVDINADAVGTMYHITGTPSDAMIATTSGGFEAQSSLFNIAAGTLDLKCTASVTGQIKWTVLYYPVYDDAYITVA